MNRKVVLQGVVLDSQTIFTLTEFCQACSVERTLILQMVEDGVIEPVAKTEQWQFHGHSVIRAQRAMRLVQDLGVNWPGAALALDLLERLEALER